MKVKLTKKLEMSLEGNQVDVLQAMAEIMRSMFENEDLMEYVPIKRAEDIWDLSGEILKCVNSGD